VTKAPAAAPPTPFWSLSADQALAVLGSEPEGLSDAEAAARLKTYGPNVLPEPRATPAVLVFLRQFRSPLIYLLLAAGAVSLALRHFSDAGFILGVLMLNAVIGALQEWKAEAGAAALKRTLHLHPTVLRAGVRKTIDLETLVPGDVVLLESGAGAPADLRLLSARQLRVDESLLTGESEPVLKDAAAHCEPGAPLGDRLTMVHAGTTVAAGRAAGVVSATGARTQLGGIAGSLAGEGARPPLLLRMEAFARRIALAALVLMALLGAGLLARGAAPAEVFLLAVALAVAAVPEGLPVAITVALSVASSRMARRNVIVRQLPAVEGLGSCTLIASDKTGTLTVNRLTVQRLALPSGHAADVEGEGLDLGGELRPDAGSGAGPGDWPRFLALAVCGVLANEGRITRVDGAVEAAGDAVDVAFLMLGAKLGLWPDALARDHRQAAMIPYEPERGYSASLNEGPEGRRIHVKGAPERVLPFCADIDTDRMLAHASRLAAAGYRVIALAEGPARPHLRKLEEDDLQGLRLLGFAGLIDPLRREAAEAVARCRSAGLQVRMITGDHPETALAIARKLDPAHPPAEVVTGRELAALSGRALEDRILSAEVYARVEPAQKTLIVQALQRGGHFVAVTGDGVNDAPALKAAHVGVAMGASGTDVARAAADLIITDDNFASIVAGVEEGRTAYDNIRKMVWFLLSTGVAEIMLFMLALGAGLPMPLTAVQILWLNLVTEGIQDVGLALEGKEPSVMSRPPRRPNEPIFDRRMIVQCLVTGGYIGGLSFGLFWWLHERSGLTEEAARNWLMLFLVFFQNLHVLNCRSEVRSFFRVPIHSNPALLIGIAAALGVHVSAMYLPGLSGVLGAAPLEPAQWGAVLALAATVLAVGELLKRLAPRAPAREPA